MHGVNERRWHGLGTRRSLANHACPPVTKLGKIPHTIKFWQRALRIDYDGADVFGFREIKEAGFLATVSPDMFFDTFKPATIIL